jgi:hypothetical protein
MTMCMHWLFTQRPWAVAGWCLVITAIITSPALAVGPEDMGEYTGTWINHTFYDPEFPDAATGPVHVTLALSDSDLHVAVEIGGTVFGIGTPPPMAFDVPLAWNGDELVFPVQIHATQAQTLVWDITGTLQADGALELTFDNFIDDFAYFGFTRMEAWGTLGGGLIDLAYDVYRTESATGGEVLYARGQLTALIPEPATAVLLLLSGATLFSRRTRSSSRLD